MATADRQPTVNEIAIWEVSAQMLSGEELAERIVRIEQHPDPNSALLEREETYRRELRSRTA